jgi:hypothetical protein
VTNFREWRRIYPAKVEFELRRLRGRDDLWVAEVIGSYDDGPPYYGLSILEFRGDKVAPRDDLRRGGLGAPEWRAPWRAAP